MLEAFVTFFFYVPCVFFGLYLIFFFFGKESRILIIGVDLWILDYFIHVRKVRWVFKVNLGTFLFLLQNGYVSWKSLTLIELWCVLQTMGIDLKCFLITTFDQYGNLKWCLCFERNIFLWRYLLFMCQIFVSISGIGEFLLHKQWCCSNMNLKKP